MAGFLAYTAIAQSEKFAAVISGGPFFRPVLLIAE
jgi:hypothetical protein